MTSSPRVSSLFIFFIASLFLVASGPAPVEATPPPTSGKPRAGAQKKRAKRKATTRKSSSKSAQGSSIDAGERKILVEAPGSANHRGAGTQPATGLVYRVEKNPSKGAPIFQVRSSGETVRLFAEHDGWTGATHNSAWFGGKKKNYLAGNTGIGTQKPGAFKLRVGGNAKVDGSLLVAGAMRLSQWKSPMGNRNYFLDLENTQARYAGDQVGLRICTNDKCDIGGKIYSSSTYPLVIEGMGRDQRVEVRSSLGAKKVSAATVCVSGDCRTKWPEAKVLWDENGPHISRMNGRVGIGVATPRADLHIRRKPGSGGYTTLRVENGKNDRKGAQIELLNGDPDQVQFNLGVGGKKNGKLVEDKLFIWKQRANGSAGDLLLTLDTAGTLKVRKVTVTQKNWADHVFEEDYPLPSLEEVEDYIARKGHLPGVPSAAEVAREGVDLGTMDATLLQKIEELTRYQIELHKSVKRLEGELEDLRQENQRLRDRLDQEAAQ